EEPDSLSEALSRLRRQVDEGEAREGGGGTGGQGAPRDRLTALDIYKLEIRYHILENWVYSRRLAGKDQDLKAAIGITIAADGKITDIWYDRRSGNQYFDESAYKAVLKSDRLPALPEGYETYTVGLEFTPSDIPAGQRR
ncbi:MAG: energy transducer TonB, partial [Desulfosudaceae bacterium]